MQYIQKGCWRRDILQSSCPPIYNYVQRLLTGLDRLSFSLVGTITSISMVTGPPVEGAGNEEKEHYDSTTTLSEHQQEELRTIASRQSAVSTTAGKHSEQGFGSHIDPTSPHFDLSQWMRYQVQQFEEDSSARKTGVVFKDVTVQGRGAEIQIQHTVLSSVYAPILGGAFRRGSNKAKTILHDVHGHIEQGEMLLVLGRPGAGCSTMLKTISADTNGLDLSSNSAISYNGIPQPLMQKNYKGELLYNQEVEKRKDIY